MRGSEYVGAYGFAISTWNMLCQTTGTSSSDYSPAHQDAMADELVKLDFGGNWNNVPKSGGW